MKLADAVLDQTLQFYNGKATHTHENGIFTVYGSNGPIGFSNEFNHEAAIILGRVGAYCGSVEVSDDKFWASDNTIVVKPKPGQSLHYWYYLLKTLSLRSYAGGAAQPLLTHGILSDVKTKYHSDFHQQIAIASILSAYDDLKENNNRRIKLLEESARLLYQEWFIRLRFPGYEHTRIVDGVPEGWEKVLVSEAIEINPKTLLSDADEHWWVEMADLPINSMVIQNVTKRDGRSGSKFRNGDTLFARITPCLENGKTGFVNFMEEGEVGRGSTEFIVLRSKRLTPEFVYCLSRTYDFRENAIKSMIGASGRQRVQESCFEKFLVLVPTQLLLTLFKESAEPLFQQTKVLHSQNQKLKAARDILLPRLMSGEIAV